MQSNIRQKVTLALALLAGASLLLAACGSSNPQTISAAELDQALEDYSPSINASAIVVPIQRASLSVSYAGSVEQILVGVDDQVQAGDVLLRLSGAEQFESSLAASQLELLSAQKALEDFIDNAALAEANAKDALEDAQRDYENIITPAEDVDVDQAYANMILAKEALDKAQENFDEHSHKPTDNLVRATYQSKLSQAQNEYDDAVRRYNAYSTPGNDTEVAIKRAELDLAQKAYDDAKDGPAPDLLAQAEARVRNAEAQMAAAQAALDDLQITAPFDGSVAQILVHENDWVVPGQYVIAVGDFSAFQVLTTDLNEVDVAQISIGQSALVTFDALPAIDIQAEVVKIARKSTPGEGVNYEVTLELAETPVGLLWDMSALVEFPQGQ